MIKFRKIQRHNPYPQKCHCCNLILELSSWYIVLEHKRPYYLYYPSQQLLNYKTIMCYDCYNKYIKFRELNIKYIKNYDIL